MQTYALLTKRCYTLAAFAVVTVATIGGCSQREYELAEVDGVLTIKGQPGNKVHIEFVPDGITGPRSSADTDDQGRFALCAMERDGSAPAGAVVGKHKVTLSDLRLSESATGQGVPIRFGSEYTLSGSTPLSQEVKAGEKQTVRLEVR